MISSGVDTQALSLWPGPSVALWGRPRGTATTWFAKLLSSNKLAALGHCLLRCRAEERRHQAARWQLGLGEGPPVPALTCWGAPCQILPGTASPSARLPRRWVASRARCRAQLGAVAGLVVQPNERGAFWNLFIRLVSVLAGFNIFPHSRAI